MKPSVIVGALAGAVLFGSLAFVVAQPGKKVTTADLEERLMQEPISGSYLSAFREALPDDYATIIPPLLMQAVENPNDPGLFDRMLTERIHVFVQDNLVHLVSAEAASLAEFADRQAEMIKVPRICEIVMGDLPRALDPKDTEARQLFVARDIAIFRGIASGREHAVKHPEPASEKDISLNERIAPYLTAEERTAIADGSFARRSPTQRCPLVAAYWQVIAKLPESQSAVWAAFLLRQGI